MSDNGSGSVVVQNPLSSWDACMSKTYCKWPVIVGIILGGIIVLSIVWCLVRCICGGIIDCCCMCGNCCSSRRRNNYAYQQPPPPPPQYPMYNQYQPPQQPMYSAAPMYASSPMYAPPQMSGGAGHRGAPYEVQNKSGGTTTFNEDALPAMPSWDQGRDRHVAHDDVEMGHIQSPQAAQQQGLLQSPNNTGDLGAMNAAPAQHYDHDDLNRHGSLYSQGAVSSQAPNRVTSMRTTLYEPSLYPPSYHTQAPGGYYAPGAAAPPAGQTIGRKPVPSSWRDV